MNTSSITGTGSRRNIGRRGQALLVGLLAVALAVGVMAVFAPIPQAATPAAGNNANAVAAIQWQEALKDQHLNRMGASAVPLTSLSAERAEEHRWLNGRAPAAAALVAAQQLQAELKDQWLERRSPSGYPFISLTAERAQEHRWLNERRAAHAALVRQDELKEQWLARHQ